MDERVGEKDEQGNLKGVAERGEMSERMCEKGNKHTACRCSILFRRVLASVTSVKGDTLPWLDSPVAAALVAPLM